mgnify:CR=1 FL=1
MRKLSHMYMKICLRIILTCVTGDRTAIQSLLTITTTIGPAWAIRHYDDNKDEQRGNANRTLDALRHLEQRALALNRSAIGRLFQVLR